MVRVKIKSNVRREIKSRALGSVFFLVLFLVFSSTAWAQMDTGTITGVLHDEQGAVITNASVAITTWPRASSLRPGLTMMEHIRSLV